MEVCSFDLLSSMLYNTAFLIKHYSKPLRSLSAIRSIKPKHCKVAVLTISNNEDFLLQSMVLDEELIKNIRIILYI